MDFSKVAETYKVDKEALAEKVRYVRDVMEEAIVRMPTDLFYNKFSIVAPTKDCFIISFLKEIPEHRRPSVTVCIANIFRSKANQLQHPVVPAYTSDFWFLNTTLQFFNNGDVLIAQGELKKSFSTFGVEKEQLALMVLNQLCDGTVLGGSNYFREALEGKTKAPQLLP